MIAMTFRRRDIASPKGWRLGLESDNVILVFGTNVKDEFSRSRNRLLRQARASLHLQPFQAARPKNSLSPRSIESYRQLGFLVSLLRGEGRVF